MTVPRAELYLDWNATARPHPLARAAMERAREAAWANPASVHSRGRAARVLIEELREALAQRLDVHSRDVVLTGSGTEANNLALSGVRSLVTSRLEHPSVTRVAEQVAATGGRVWWLPVPSSGRLEPADVARALHEAPRGTTVAVMAANHELGTVQPVAEIAALCEAADARLHCDATQALGKLDPARFSAAHSWTVTAHKLGGPKGIAALAWRGAWKPEPVLRGGAQERGLRPGTADAVTAAGFKAALDAASPRDHAQLAPLRDALEQALAPHGRVNGSAERLPHVTNLSFDGWRGDELCAALDLAGIYVSSGSACSAGSAEPSPVVTAALGPERALSAVRISLGEPLVAEQLQYLIATFHQVLARNASRG